VSADPQNQITVWSIVSLLLGTVISAIVSYILQQRSFSEARMEKQKNRFEMRKVLGLNIFHKMLRIASTLHYMKKHLDECLVSTGVDAQTWHRLVPIAVAPYAVKFTPEELTFLMLMDMELFDDIGPYDEIHNNLLMSLELYKTKRTALLDTLPAKMIDGHLGTVNLSEADWLKIGPKIAELNALIDQIVQRTQQDSKKAWELLEKLATSLNKEFKLQLRLERN
jgi:hypothetical protein